jgi:hypothetical protein
MRLRGAYPNRASNVKDLLAVRKLTNETRLSGKSEDCFSNSFAKRGGWKKLRLSGLLMPLAYTKKICTRRT